LKREAEAKNQYYKNASGTVDDHIAKAKLTITALGQSKAYGVGYTLNQTRYTISGLAGTETATVTMTAPASPSGLGATDQVGSYPIHPTATGSGLDNYAITYVDGTLAVAPAPPGSTPPGSYVAVTPVITGGSATGVTVTFDQVTGGGTTSAALSSAGPPAPGGFELASSPTYYDITTTATYADSITVCLPYDPIAYGDPSLVRLLHWNGSSWDDVTSSLDTTADLVCGTTATLSPFVALAARS